LTPFEKIVGGAPIPDEVHTLARLGHFVARVKISGRSTAYRGLDMVFRKNRFYGYTCTSKSP